MVWGGSSQDCAWQMEEGRRLAFVHQLFPRGWDLEEWQRGRRQDSGFMNRTQGACPGWGGGGLRGQRGRVNAAQFGEVLGAGVELAARAGQTWGRGRFESQPSWPLWDLCPCLGSQRQVVLRVKSLGITGGAKYHLHPLYLFPSHSLHSTPGLARLGQALGALDWDGPSQVKKSQGEGLLLL